MCKKYKRIVCTLFLILVVTVQAQTVEEMQRLKSEYERNQKLISPDNADFEQVQTIDPLTGLPKKAQLTPYILPETLELEEKEITKFFGYNFFTKRDTVKFWENLPTPSNYLLGQGDELVILLWGETQLRETFTINRGGNIYDGKVGLLNLTGKTIQEAKTYLKDQFSRVYATLKDPNPSTFIDISLGELRSINVNFVGQLKYPGVYPIHPFSTIITGIIQAGGVDTTGSLRSIMIRRDGKIITTVDLYSYFLMGDLPEKIQLRDQDIVVIPARKSIVTIDSAVVNPGIYEALSGETVYDMIQYAGGVTPEAANTVGLQQINAVDNNGNSKYENFYLKLEDAKLIKVQKKNHITVRSIFHEQQFVQLIGQVKVPGMYNFYEGMGVRDLLKLGGGLEDSTFAKSIYLKKAEIIRRNSTNRYEEIITMDLRQLFPFSEENTDIPLQSLDKVVIHANLNYFERKSVQILGEVNIPGSYPLLNDNETLQSLINRAGGLSSKALDNGISIFREKNYFEEPPKDKVLTQLQEQTGIGRIIEKETDKIKLAWEGLAATLMPGDSIVIKEKVGAVYVTGEVYNAGLVEFQRGKSIQYYLNSAGGINNYGNRDNVIVVYPNGITVPWRRFRSPKILDGSTIVVYQKADLTPFDATLFANNTASLLSSLITILVLVEQLKP